MSDESTPIPVCKVCGSDKWFYGHQVTVFYEVTSFRPTDDGDEGDLIAIIDPTAEEETDCAWRDVQCENEHSLDSWDRTTESSEEGR